MFVLIVDDFSIEYVGEQHLNHLRTVLTTHYTITEDLEGGGGFWHRTQVELHQTPLPTHISSLHGRLHFQPDPQVWPQSSRQTSTFPAPPPQNKLHNEGIKRVQAIIRALLYYARAVHNRLLVGLSAIGYQQAEATEKTAAAIDQILDNVATYPKDGITYRASDMILASHSDDEFNNKSKARICAGAHIFYQKMAQRPSGTDLSSQSPRSLNFSCLQSLKRNKERYT